MPKCFPFLISPLFASGPAQSMPPSYGAFPYPYTYVHAHQGRAPEKASPPVSTRQGSEMKTTDEKTGSMDGILGNTDVAQGVDV